MPSWSEFEDQAPAFAALARQRLESRTHHVLATLRHDRSPRLSGIELIFADGELWFGSMLAGRAVEVSDPAVLARVVGESKPPGPMHLFKADVHEVTLVRLETPEGPLLIESWHPERGVETLRR